jgi:hypothetical protein
MYQKNEFHKHFPDQKTDTQISINKIQKRVMAREQDENTES